MSDCIDNLLKDASQMAMAAFYPEFVELSGRLKRDINTYEEMLAGELKLLEWRMRSYLSAKEHLVTVQHKLAELNRKCDENNLSKGDDDDSDE